MIATQIMDTVMASLGHLIILHTIYKFLTPKPTAKYMRFVFPVVFSIYYFIISYSTWFLNLVTDTSTRAILIPIMIFIFIGIYVATQFSSSLKLKIIAFLGSIMAMIGAEVTAVFLVIPFGIVGEATKNLPFESRFVLNLVVLFLYTTYSVAAYYIFKNYKSRFPWKITLNIAVIITSCILLFLLIINVTSTNVDYLKIAISIAFISIALLIFSLIQITKYINNQTLEKENLYWKQQLHNLNLKYSQTFEEKSNQIRQIQHDFKDSLEIIKLLLEDNNKDNVQQAEKLVNDLNTKINDSKINYYTSYVTINAILTYKIDEAKKLGITITPTINLPDHLNIQKNIKDLDFDVLIINLLNNAIEACKDLDDTFNKNIEIKMAIKGNFLFIKTVNPYKSIDYDSNKFVTTKTDKENHGLGMGIIDTIVNSYGGTQTITTTNNTFTHIISLDIEQAPLEY